MRKKVGEKSLSNFNSFTLNMNKIYVVTLKVGEEKKVRENEQKINIR